MAGRRPTLVIARILPFTPCPMAHDLIASCAPTLMSTGLIHSPPQWPDLRLRIVNGVLGEVDLIACLSLERAGMNQNCFASS